MAASSLRALRGRPGAVVLGGDALAAHAHVDAQSGRLLVFSHRIALTARGLVTRLTLYEFDEVRCCGALHSTDPRRVEACGVLKHHMHCEGAQGKGEEELLSLTQSAFNTGISSCFVCRVVLSEVHHNVNITSGGRAVVLSAAQSQMPP